jgi:hypothetical protein
VVLSPLDLLSRLCALVPAPRFHLTRYAGLLSSHASLRREVVPKAVVDPELCKPQLSLFDAAGHKPAVPALAEPLQPAGRKPWAWLLRRVDADRSVCPRCLHGKMRITTVALTARAIAQALARHGLGARPPPQAATPEALGQLPLAFAP